MTIGHRIIHNLTLSVEQANELYNDLEQLETTGCWNNEYIPEWAKELAKHYQTAEGSTIVALNGWRAIAKAYRIWKTGYCSGTKGI